MTAPEMFAASQGYSCEGKERCHWCGAPCAQLWTHDDRIPLVGQRSTSTALVPASHWICNGCWLWRKERVTVNFLLRSGEISMKDCQRPQNHSWLLTAEAAWGLQPESGPSLWERLLRPAEPFALALMVNGPTLSGILPRSGIANQLHLATVNEIQPTSGHDPGQQFRFTLNNAPHAYSVHEVETAAAGINGKEPGTQALFRLFGEPPAHLLPSKDEPKKGGRPAGSARSRKDIKDYEGG